jgi:WD40 repeat protein
LIAAVNGRAVQIWSIETGRSLQTLDGHQDSIVGLASSCNRALIAAGSDDWTVRIWSADMSSTTASSTVYDSRDSNIVLSEDQTLLASVMGSEDGQSTWVWRVDTGDCVQRVSGLAPNLLALSPTELLIAEVSRSRDEFKIMILNADTRVCVQVVSVKDTWSDGVILSVTSDDGFLADDNFSFSSDGELLIHKS